jgi:hypothetical protein
MNFLIIDVAVIVAAIAVVVLLLSFVIRTMHPARRRRPTNHQHIPACYSQPPAETGIENRK